jgi:hypothetical protein
VWYAVDLLSHKVPLSARFFHRSCCSPFSPAESVRFLKLIFEAVYVVLGSAEAEPMDS